MTLAYGPEDDDGRGGGNHGRHQHGGAASGTAQHAINQAANAHGLGQATGHHGQGGILGASGHGQRGYSGHQNHQHGSGESGGRVHGHNDGDSNLLKNNFRMNY